MDCVPSFWVHEYNTLELFYASRCTRYGTNLYILFNGQRQQAMFSLAREKWRPQNPSNWQRNSIERSWILKTSHLNPFGIRYGNPSNSLWKISTKTGNNPDDESASVCLPIGNCSNLSANELIDSDDRKPTISDWNRAIATQPDRTTAWRPQTGTYPSLVTLNGWKDEL